MRGGPNAYSFDMRNGSLTLMYYVIQVKTGQEEEMMEDIESLAKGRYDVAIFIPKRVVLRKRAGEYVRWTEKCFPGYLFVETDSIRKIFYDLPKIDGFHRILGREDLSTLNFRPLSEDESRMIDILYNAGMNRTIGISNIEVKDGDIVQILDGPLAYQEGIVRKMNLHKRKATIELSLFSRKIEVDIGINIVNKKQNRA